MHEAYINLNSAAQEGTQSWERILHANYETARKIGRKWLQNTATNVDAAFSGPVHRRRAHRSRRSSALCQVRAAAAERRELADSRRRSR